MVMSLQVPKQAGDFSTSWATIIFYRRALLHEVSYKINERKFHSSKITRCSKLTVQGMRFPKRWFNLFFGFWCRVVVWWGAIVSEDHAASIFSMRSRQHGPVKHWCPATPLQGVTTRKTMTRSSWLYKTMFSLLSNGWQEAFPGEKRLGGEAGHSPPSSTEVKNAWISTSTPQYAFLA
jgi:hypothetical protein